jgi:pyrroline-5-carboxylate reductase
MALPQSVCVIGYGNMGRALVRGWLAAGMSPQSIFVVESNPDAVEAAAKLHLLDAGACDGSTRFDVVLVAVKPQQLAAALSDSAAFVARSEVVLSVAAGKTLAAFEKLIGPRPVVRAMPNTPAAIAQAATVLCANSSTEARHKSHCNALMAAVGTAHWVDEEALIDAVTALSGSGPAYVFLMIECLARAAVVQGLPVELAMALAKQTVAGSAEYARESAADVVELRRQVTSPAGTTEAALSILLEDDALCRLLDAAVAAATARSRALSGT